MSNPMGVYATDEDLALAASADFALLCPRDQVLAVGADGAFAAVDRWTLTSATADFAAQGVGPGHVVQLLGPSPRFRAPGEALAVEATGPGWVRLRRKGQAPGAGQPPGPAGGLTGVEFLVTSLAPQIERASFDLNRRYGIDDLTAGRRAADLYDPREVRDAVVLAVLHGQYAAMARGTSGAPDPFAVKARQARGALDELLARVVVHWTARPGAGTTRFHTRIER
jgi:hypothetical protein